MIDDVFHGRRDCTTCEANPANCSEQYHRHPADSSRFESCSNCTKYLSVKTLAHRVPAPAPIHPDGQNGAGARSHSQKKGIL